MLISIPAAADWLREHDHYTILTHRRPDGDTVGSTAALCLGLRAMGKDAALFPNRQITPRLEPYTLGLTDSALEGRTLLAADISSVSLFPFGAEDVSVRLCIDHHGSNDDYAARTLVDASCAACAELIYQVLLTLGVTVTPKIADALYLGLSTDTGCFQYANVTAQSFRIAGELKALGADCYGINKTMFATKSLSRLRVEAYLTDHLAFYAGGLVGICALPEAVMAELGVTEDDADGLSGFARDVEGVQIAGMLREIEDGQGKISLRTGTEYDAAAICRHLGGGGHKGAAGASVPGGIEGARQALLKAIRAQTGLDV